MTGLLGIGSQAPPYCKAQVLTLEELARYELPNPPSVSHLELYRELFHSVGGFAATVKALEAKGWLPKRPDGTYRAWDAYEIVDRIGHHASVSFPGPPPVQASLATFPFLHFLNKLGEEWWAPVEAARVGLEYLWRSRVPDFVRDSTKSGGWREETYDEIALRLATLQPMVMAEAKVLADQLPADVAYWKEHLGSTAWLVIELRRAHFASLARFCSYQLEAAVDLAELRLAKTRRELRALVGTSHNDMTAPALSAASFSISWKAFDAALDELEKALPAYNAAMPAPLQLGPEQPEQFLRFLTDCGLQQWYTELTTVTWHNDMFFDQSHDQRVAVVYGRVRTLCTLLEESLLSLADHVGDASFVKAVEDGYQLGARLKRFLDGARGAPPLVNAKEVLRLARASSIKPGMDAKEVATGLAALGIRGTHATGPVIAPSPEQVLASLLVIRNLTSHRFPIVRAGARAAWFDAWSEYLPGVNQAIPWVALALWAITAHYKR